MNNEQEVHSQVLQLLGPPLKKNSLLRTMETNQVRGMEMSQSVIPCVLNVLMYNSHPKKVSMLLKDIYKIVQFSS